LTSFKFQMNVEITPEFNRKMTVGQIKASMHTLLANVSGHVRAGDTAGNIDCLGDGKVGSWSLEIENASDAK